MGRVFQPFDVGNRFRIVPHVYDSVDKDKIDLVMQPGAFGSGEHETTASCLEQLASLIEVQQARVLDLGSGTGILAIAALKLGAHSALCVDIDEAAVQTCQTNCRLNGVAHQVTHLCGTVGQITLKDFDLVIANIYGDILVNIAEGLVGITKRNGILLLSGILYQDNFDVKKSYTQQSCTVLSNHMLQEYTTMLLRKTGRLA